MIINFIADPSHGWGEVPVKLIHDLGIAGKISRYSYVKGENAYLEEDCDLGIFIHALESTGEKVSFEEHHSNYDSWVRNCQRWQA